MGLLQPPGAVFLAWGRVSYRKTSFWGLKALEPLSIPAASRTRSVHRSDQPAGLGFFTAHKILGSTHPAGKSPALNNLCAKLLLWSALWDVQVGLCMSFNLLAVISKSCMSASFGAGFSFSTFCVAVANSVLGVNFFFTPFFSLKWSAYKLNTRCQTQFSSQAWTRELEEKTPFRFQGEAGRKC